MSGLLVSVGDAATGKVVGRELDLDAVSGEDADVVHAHLSRDVGQHLVPVLELDPEHGIGQRLDDGALEDDRIFLGLGQRTSPGRTWVMQRTDGKRAERAGPSGPKEHRIGSPAA